MATIGNNPDSFLHALSDFWIRFFADIGDLKATYEGTTVLFGQAYLDLLTTVLNTSVEEAPLFRKEYYQLLTVREDQVVWRQHFTKPTLSRWVVPASVNLVGAGTFQNKVYAPDAALVPGIDLDVGDGELRFIGADPTETLSLPPLFGRREVSVAVGGTFTAGVGMSSVDWLAAGVKKGDILRTHPYAIMSQGDRAAVDAQAYKVVHVSSSELCLSFDTPVPVFPTENYTPGTVAWWIDREGPDGQYDLSLPAAYVAGVASSDRGLFGNPKNITVNEFSLWAVDALVDDSVLYKNFGHMVTAKAASTESYRSLVKGLMQLYLFGPAIDRIESAMNVIAGLPVVRNDGETFVSYDDGSPSSGVAGTFGGGLFDAGSPVFSSTSVGGILEVTRADDGRNVGVWEVIEVISASVVRLEAPAGNWAQAGGVHWAYSKTGLQTVTTTGGAYEFDRRLPMRADVVAGTAPAFKAFETLTTAIRVVDYIKDPQWWHGLPVPLELLPGRSIHDRIASTDLLKNIVGAEYGGRVGDPGFYVGADENKTLGGTYRHRPAFVLMDRFLQAHIFQVKIDRFVALSPEFVTELSGVMQEAKPAFTYAYLQPGTSFAETVAVVDAVGVQAARMQAEFMSQQSHPLTVGSTPSWVVGQRWHFLAAFGFSVVLVAPTDPFIASFVPFYVGSLDPQTPTSSGYIRESALSVTTLP